MWFSIICRATREARSTRQDCPQHCHTLVTAYSLSHSVCFLNMLWWWTWTRRWAHPWHLPFKRLVAWIVTCFSYFFIPFQLCGTNAHHLTQAHQVHQVLKVRRSQGYCHTIPITHSILWMNVSSALLTNTCEEVRLTNPFHLLPFRTLTHLCCYRCTW